jgi:uncharacterized membrane protein
VHGDDAENDDRIAALHEHLHAARRALRVAYDQRDALAEEIAAAEAEVGAAVRPDLLEAFGAAERAMLAAEAEMKDAEYALAVAGEPQPPGPGSSTPTNP